MVMQYSCRSGVHGAGFGIFVLKQNVPHCVGTPIRLPLTTVRPGGRDPELSTPAIGRGSYGVQTTPVGRTIFGRVGGGGTGETSGGETTLSVYVGMSEQPLASVTLTGNPAGTGAG